MITCFIDDPAGVKMRYDIGIDTITWECDYPHSDCTWPTSPERLMKSLDGVPDDDIDKMTHLNAMRDFHFDPFAHRAKQDCTVGALRAEATAAGALYSDAAGKFAVLAKTARNATIGFVVLGYALYWARRQQSGGIGRPRPRDSSGA